jgi:hypothetical protein
MWNENFTPHPMPVKIPTKSMITMRSPKCMGLGHVNLIQLKDTQSQLNEIYHNLIYSNNVTKLNQIT